jgi:hypothetical protein
VFITFIEHMTKDHKVDFLILLLKWYLAYYMFDYGIAKILGSQFGLHDPKMMHQPLEKIDRFYLAWYLFSLNNTFNVLVGSFQIFCSLLLIINYTTLIGAIFVLPVLGQILLIDLIFTTNVFGFALVQRILIMIVSDFIILIYYKRKILEIFASLTNLTKYNYKWWLYLLLPIFGLLMDFFFAIPLVFIKKLFGLF